MQQTDTQSGLQLAGRLCSVLPQPLASKAFSKLSLEKLAILSHPFLASSNILKLSSMVMMPTLTHVRTPLATLGRLDPGSVTLALKA
jgi:hypothetical protein